MRRRISVYRITPAGGAMAMLLVAAATLVLFGPKHDEVPALVVIVAVFAIFVVGAFPGGLRTRRRTFSEYEGLFHPRDRGLKDEQEAPVDEALWQRERERGEQKSRGTD